MFQAEGTASAGALRGEQAYKVEGQEDGIVTPKQHVRSSLGGPKRDSKEPGHHGLSRPSESFGFYFKNGKALEVLEQRSDNPDSTLKR